MTDAQRRTAIIGLIEKYTEKNSGSRAAARSTLLNEGIYTKKGALRVEYGGAGSKKAKG